MSKSTETTKVDVSPSAIAERIRANADDIAAAAADKKAAVLLVALLIDTLPSA